MTSFECNDFYKKKFFIHLKAFIKTDTHKPVCEYQKFRFANQLFFHEFFFLVQFFYLGIIEHIY